MLVSKTNGGGTTQNFLLDNPARNIYRFENLEELSQTIRQPTADFKEYEFRLHLVGSHLVR